MERLANRLQVVMERLSNLNDLNRMGHTREASTVFGDFADYIEHFSAQDHAVIDDGIRAGLVVLTRLRRHEDLGEVKGLYGITTYVQRHLSNDINAIEDAIAELHALENKVEMGCAV